MQMTDRIQLEGLTKAGRVWSAGDQVEGALVEVYPGIGWIVFWVRAVAQSVVNERKS